MAFKALTPATMNVAIQTTLAQQFDSPVVNDLAGSPVDFSAWTSLQAVAAPGTPAPCAAPISFGTVTGTNDGKVHLETSATDLASSAPGSCRLIISGKPTSGDALQVIATGILTVQQGAAS